MKKAILFASMLVAAMLVHYANARCKAVPGYVYIMQEKQPNGNDGILYKVGGVIGPSKKVDTRRGNLQTGNPRELTVEKKYKVSNCKEAEGKVHDAFKPKVNNNYNAASKYKIDYGGGTEWYKVPANKYGNFKSVIETAIQKYRLDDDDDDDEMDWTNTKHLLMRLLRI